MTVRVGCSGYVYRDWRDVVYPADLPMSQWLSWYATQFDSVELNSTFYRLPSEAAVRGWASQVDERFVFAVKVGAFGTHRKKLIDAASWLPRHLERVELLGGALGPNLFQLPPRWRRNVARLEELLAVLPGHVRWAVEVRDPSWLHDDVFAALERHGVSLCIHDLIADHPFVRTADWLYVRFHGPRGLREPYRGMYGPARLSLWAEEVGTVADEGDDVYCYFNNDFDGMAVRDARWLRSALADVRP